jgi:uncharacterized membrane protein YgcG
MQSVSAQALPANCWAHLSVAAAGAQRRPSWGQVSLGLRGSALPALAASGLATSTTCGPCYNFNMWALSASLCKRVLAHYSQAPNLLRREMVQARPAAATAVPPPRPDSPSGDSPGYSDDDEDGSSRSDGAPANGGRGGSGGASGGGGSGGSGGDEGSGNGQVCSSPPRFTLPPVRAPHCMLLLECVFPLLQLQLPSRVAPNGQHPR